MFHLIAGVAAEAGGLRASGHPGQPQHPGHDRVRLRRLLSRTRLARKHLIASHGPPLVPK